MTRQLVHDAPSQPGCLPLLLQRGSVFCLRRFTWVHTVSGGMSGRNIVILVSGLGLSAWHFGFSFSSRFARLGSSRSGVLELWDRSRLRFRAEGT